MVRCRRCNWPVAWLVCDGHWRPVNPFADPAQHEHSLIARQHACQDKPPPTDEEIEAWMARRREGGDDPIPF